jgi:dTDP-4-dehydrorhamnose 3,5-epimerase
MQVIQTPFEGLFQLIPNIFEDERGWFYESYKETTYRSLGINYEFVQENQSYSRKGVIRGLHFQNEPHGQAKLASVLAGKVLDVVVDLRPASRTFKQVYSCVLDSVRRNMLMVPEGFAHGFAALEDSLFFYKCSNFYHRASEGGIAFNDPQLNIQWTVPDPIVSEKDRQLPTLEEFLRKSVISRD